MNCLKNTLLIMKTQVTCPKNYVIQGVKKRGSSIFNQRSVKKNEKKNAPENNTFVIEENEKMINIVKNIPLIKQLEQQGSGLKILTPN